MAVTQEMLDKIEEALATGAKEIEYEDRRIEYQSVRDMERAASRIRRQLTGKGKASRSTFVFDKGL